MRYLIPVAVLTVLLAYLMFFYPHTEKIVYTFDYRDLSEVEKDWKIWIHEIEPTKVTKNDLSITDIDRDGDKELTFDTTPYIDEPYKGMIVLESRRRFIGIIKSVTLRIYAYQTPYAGLAPVMITTKRPSEKGCSGFWKPRGDFKKAKWYEETVETEVIIQNEPIFILLADNMAWAGTYVSIEYLEIEVAGQGLLTTMLNNLPWLPSSLLWLVLTFSTGLFLLVFFQFFSLLRRETCMGGD